MGTISEDQQFSTFGSSLILSHLGYPEWPHLELSRPACYFRMVDYQEVALERSEGKRSMSDGTGIHWCRWTSDHDAKGSVLLIHGLAEHSGRYEEVAEPLVSAGYSTFAFDLRGFGKSDGPRGHIRFSDALRDIHEFLATNPAHSAGEPLFILGHSLGGLLAMLYTLEYRPSVAGIIAIGPALHTVVREQRAKVLMAQVLGRIFPATTIPSGLDDTKLMSDPAALKSFRNDPLVHDRVSMGFGRDCFEAMDRVLSEADNIPLPLLLLHAANDEVNFLSGSQVVAEKHPGDCTLKVYDDVLHDLKCEPSWPRIAEDVVGWLDDHRRP